MSSLTISNSIPFRWEWLLLIGMLENGNNVLPPFWWVYIFSSIPKKLVPQEFDNEEEDSATMSSPQYPIPFFSFRNGKQYCCISHLWPLLGTSCDSKMRVWHTVQWRELKFLATMACQQWSDTLHQPTPCSGLKRQAVWFWYICRNTTSRGQLSTTFSRSLLRPEMTSCLVLIYL